MLLPKFTLDYNPTKGMENNQIEVPEDKEQDAQ